jgi:uncharacterized DUF497 family protein
MECTFDWDPEKAALNVRKHGVSFDRTATVFLGPRAISIPDKEHSNDNEERWVTLGLDDCGRLVVVAHTFEQLDEERCRIRLISARKATRTESR